MLVLTRRRGESLRIGNDIRLTVVSSSTGHVRIAIDAPDEVAIHREEVFERIAQANQEAAHAADDSEKARTEASEPRRRMLRVEAGGAA